MYNAFLRLSIYILIMSFALVGRAESVWQWSVPVESRYHPDSRAYLWIPENCEYVKSIVFAQNNMEELSILECPVFREEMAKMDVAIVWVSPWFDLFFRFNEGAGEYFNQMMDDLAEVSGYEELAYMPIVYMGHSAAASAPYYFAAWNPGRTLAAISVSGQWPYFRAHRFAPDIWEDYHSVNYIPLLETMGEYEAAATFSREGLKQRQEYPLMPLSMLACPAEGHFATSVKKNKYLAFFISKALEHRFPKDYIPYKMPVLNRIDPTKTGWLMEKWIPNQPCSVAPDPVEEYIGNPADAFWFFDEETVERTIAYQSEYRNMKPQLVSFSQNGDAVKQRNSHLQVHLKFEPLEDGISFSLKSVFLDTVPGESPRLANWTGLPVGAKLNHADNTIPIEIEIISGPVKKLNDSLFCLSLTKGMKESEEMYALNFAAKHSGDSEFKAAVQQAEMKLPKRNKNGREQTINFPTIKDVSANTKEIELQAVSDARLPVYYYIKYGPATIDGNTLYIQDLPPRTKYPVEVCVVAWQYGNKDVQTAEPVTRIFRIDK